MSTKIKFGALFLLLISLLVPVMAARAAGVRTGNSVYISPDQIVSGSLFAAGQTITVDGTVSGDLVVAAQNLNINGSVGGDVIAVAQNITISGNVSGNIRVLGSSVTLSGAVTRNVDAAAANLILEPGSQIGWDAYLAANTLESRGVINGNLNAWSNQGLLAGKIGKDAALTLTRPESSLTVTSAAVINGNLTYTAKKAAAIDSNANIAGKVQQNQPPQSATGNLATWLWQKIFTIFSALVVGLVLIFLSRNLTTRWLADLNDKPGRSLLAGLIVFFLMPSLALILLFTIIGSPLALIIVALWLIGVYLAKILAAIFLGSLIIKLFNNNNPPLIWPLLLGVIIAWLLFALPLVGWLLSLLAAWFGLGALWFYAHDQLRHI